MYLALPLVCFYLRCRGRTTFASEIAIKKLLFLGRLTTEPNMASLSEICSMVELRAMSVGVMLSISEVLVKHDLFQYFELWFNKFTFPTYTDWKRIVRDKIQVFERDAWS